MLSFIRIIDKWICSSLSWFSNPHNLHDHIFGTQYTGAYIRNFIHLTRCPIPILLICHLCRFFTNSVGGGILHTWSKNRLGKFSSKVLFWFDFFSPHFKLQYPCMEHNKLQFRNTFFYKDTKKNLACKYYTGFWKKTIFANFSLMALVIAPIVCTTCAYCIHLPYFYNRLHRL